jgi:hypothetical protein
MKFDDKYANVFDEAKVKEFEKRALALVELSKGYYIRNSLHFQYLQQLEAITGTSSNDEYSDEDPFSDSDDEAPPKKR